ncbi:MAG TPA: hypothetical protein VJU83_08025 [Burkholderiales bacterium]|nr:hypothetical protein [Burkholderiales bacterium]
MSLELVLSWVALGMAAGLFGNLLRSKRLPLWDVISFAVLGAILCGLIAWALHLSGWATFLALLGAIAGSYMTPQYIAPSAKRKRHSWFTA